MNIPEGFHTLNPYMFIDNADDYLVFLKQGLGAEEVHCSRREDGKIANAQLRIGNSMIMLSESTGDFPSMCSAYYLFVADADASMERAQQVGARVIMKVTDMPYGDRQGGVRDSAGNIWWISQRLSGEAYDA